MQERHTNRQHYFNELANTARSFYIPYLSKYTDLKEGTKILEVGCGEGGNLLPFAEMGCKVTGLDRSAERIEQAKEFFPDTYDAEFIAIDFFELTPVREEDKYDIILIHDVIEHIGAKHKFISHLKHFLRSDGVIFWGFPAWQMPFGGHQQICRNKRCSHFPFLHLLPKSLYRSYLKGAGEKESCIEELLDIKECRTTIEMFEKLIKANDMRIVNRFLWFINPHYQEKFNLKPRKLAKFIAVVPYIRNYFCTACFYLTKN